MLSLPLPRAGRIGDGGKWVCGMRMLQEMRHCLVYSLGSQGDTSFEDEFLERTACEVSRNWISQV